MIGNACLLGQIATLMDALHMSYEEVVDGHPYRTLMIMQKDKLRPCYGTKVRKVSGKEMAARRKGRRD